MGFNVKEQLERLESGIKDLASSDTYMQYLSAMSKFVHYSYGNIMLIFLQRPDATLVAGYTDWIRKFRRYVRKGETGIRILAPCTRKKEEDGSIIVTGYRSVSVFDISQTEGEPIPNITPQLLDGSVENYNLVLDAVKRCTSFTVKFAPLSDCYGRCDYSVKEITIMPDMSQEQTIETCLHEVAHSIMHADADTSLLREDREVEAESVAYVVSAFLGIDTSNFSFPYVLGWQGSDKERLKKSLAKIQKISSQIITQIEKQLYMPVSCAV